MHQTRALPQASRAALRPAWPSLPWPPRLAPTARKRVMGSAMGGIISAVAGPVIDKVLDKGFGLLDKLIDGIFGGDEQKAQAGVQNTANKTVLDGLQQAMDFAGVPKFLQQQVMDAANGALPQDSSVDAQQQQACDDHLAPQSQQAASDIGRNLGAETKKCKKEEDEEGGGSGSWLVALARAMGKSLGQKAADIVKKSDQMNKKIEDSKDLRGEEKAQAAAESTQMSTELQGMNQEFSMLSNAFNTALKNMGEALTTLARKQ